MSFDLEPRRADLVRVDLLLELERAGALTATALTLTDPDLPYETFEALCTQVGVLSSGSRFWLGDLLLFGEIYDDERAAQASEHMKLSENGRMEALRVARVIPPAMRRPALSWWHHRLVASRWLTPDERVELLDRSEAERLTTRQLEEIVNKLRDARSGSGGATADEPPVVVEAVLAETRALVRSARCLGAFECQVPTERVVRLRELLGEDVEP